MSFSQTRPSLVTLVFVLALVCNYVNGTQLLSGSANGLGGVMSSDLGGAMTMKIPTLGGIQNGDDAAALHSEAQALHKSGDYAGALITAREALAVLEQREVSDPSTLHRIRLCAAAAALKQNSWVEAEAFCSAVVKEGEQGAEKSLAQLAYYRRALSRRGQARAGATDAATIWIKAYRDAYMASKLASPTSAAAEKARVVLESVRIEGELTEASQRAAEKKADLVWVSWGPTTRSLSPSGLSASGLGGLLGAFGGAATGAPELAGAGAGLGGLLGGLLGGETGQLGNLLKDGGADPKALKRAGKKLLKLAKKQLRSPGTQNLVCMLLQQATPETLKSLLPIPLEDEHLSKISGFLRGTKPESLNNLVEYADVGGALLGRAQKIGALLKKLWPLLGLYLLWIWIKSCIGTIEITKIKYKMLQNILG